MIYEGNKEYKDNIFRHIFLNKDNFVELYYDITGRQLEADELEPYFTDSIVVRQLKNDVAFKTKDNRLIIMVEHQSTLNESMPVRFLLYYGELLKLYIKESKLNIFGRRAIKIPTPEFYVVYNGATELTETELSITKSLTEDKGYLQLKVDVIDINYSHLEPRLKERKDVLIGYSYLMERVRDHVKDSASLEEAIDRAIEETKIKGYLESYLTRKEFRVMMTKILSTEEEIELIRVEERLEGRAEGIAEGKAEGIEEGKAEGIELGVEKGIAEGKAEGIKVMIAGGMSIEAIAKGMNMSVAEVEALRDK